MKKPKTATWKHFRSIWSPQSEQEICLYAVMSNKTFNLFDLFRENNTLINITLKIGVMKWVTKGCNILEKIWRNSTVYISLPSVLFGKDSIKFSHPKLSFWRCNKVTNQGILNLSEGIKRLTSLKVINISFEG